MPRSFLVFLALLLAACTAPSVTNAGVTPTLAERPTSTATPRPTPTMTATSEPTLTPTPEIVMHAGIPATIEECDVLHPGTPGYEQEMRQRREADRAALAVLSGDIRFIPLLLTRSSLVLPLTYKQFNLPLRAILSCSTYQRSGERIIRFGIATSPSTIMYIDYDEFAARSYVESKDIRWWSQASFENIFNGVARGENGFVSFGVFYLNPDFPEPRPESDFGFEGAWEFFQQPLSESFVVYTAKGNALTVSSFAVLRHICQVPSLFAPESQQRILEEMEKYIWPGSIIEYVVRN